MRYDCSRFSRRLRSTRSAMAHKICNSSGARIDSPSTSTLSREARISSLAIFPAGVRKRARVRPSVECPLRSSNPSAAKRSAKRTVPACERPTPTASMLIDSPGLCASNASAEAAGPASGARDELARIMSSLIMSANAPKTFRSRGPSIATSICARGIDSKHYSILFDPRGISLKHCFITVCVDCDQSGARTRGVG